MSIESQNDPTDINKVFEKKIVERNELLDMAQPAP
jgi:hypothetical protein